MSTTEKTLPESSFDEENEDEMSIFGLKLSKIENMEFDCLFPPCDSNMEQNAKYALAQSER